VKDPAVALKVALAEFAAMETLAGTVMLPVEFNATVVPPVAGLLNVTVQTAAALAASDEGLQAMPLSSEVRMVVAVPPVAAVVIGSPSIEAPTAPDTPTVVELVPGASVTETMATAPFGIILAFSPLARQV